MQSPEMTISVEYEDNNTFVSVNPISTYYNIFANALEPDYYNWSVELPLSFVEHLEINQAIKLIFYDDIAIIIQHLLIYEKFAYTDETGIIRLRYQTPK